MLIQGIPDKYDCSSLEIIAYGAETMPPSLLSRVVEAFPHADLQQKFGTSETGTVRIQSQRKDSTYFRFKDSDTEWKSVDGVLWLKTPSRIIGYLNADNSSLEPEGWYCTGDMVEETEDGYLKITSRREDLINVGGEKVTPSEVESTLLEIPEIDDCLVYGEDNAITGQIVAAKVVPGEGVDPDQLKRQIKKYCRSKLSAYKIPARIIICDQTSFSSRFKKTR